MLDYEFRLIDSIKAIDPTDYASIINTDYPFIQFEFFKTLEDSAAIGVSSGWISQHLIIFHNHSLVAFVPLFIKTNSYGEYVFDYEWGRAYQNYGLNYYPKLVTSIPFTPATGRRIFHDPRYNKDELYRAIVKTIKNIVVNNKFSSWHLLFPIKSEHETFDEEEILKRVGVQFHWLNRNYKDFENFLKQLTAKRRKDIKRERKKVLSQGISFSIVEGKDITPEMWQDFFIFYQLTYAKKSGRTGYLPAEFFTLIGHRMPENIVMVTAEYKRKAVAAALYFKDKNTLYGRYWGCRQEFEFLHFEACYYQGIEYCITHKLKKFDAGAQGEHKIQRGFEPVFTYSNHWIENEPFTYAIKNYLEDERRLIQSYFMAASKKTPFKCL